MEIIIEIKLIKNIKPIIYIYLYIWSRNYRTLNRIYKVIIRKLGKLKLKNIKLFTLNFIKLKNIIILYFLIIIKNNNFPWLAYFNNIN